MSNKSIESLNLPFEDLSSFGNQKHLMDKGRFGGIQAMVEHGSKNQINEMIFGIEKELSNIVAQISARSSLTVIRATFSIETKTTRRARVIWRNVAKNYSYEELVQTIKGLDAQYRAWYMDHLVQVKILEQTHKLLWQLAESIDEIKGVKKDLKEDVMIH